MHRSKEYRYSITLWARASSVDGMVMPSAFDYNGNYIYEGGGARGAYRKQIVAVGEAGAY